MSETTEPQAAVVWDRARLEKRKAELEKGLESLTEQYKAAVQQQRGAIWLVEQMLAELDAPPAEDKPTAPAPDGAPKLNRAQARRLARAAKKTGGRPPEPEADGEA